jgi:predicted Rossmann fold nucleotide-binding protein DprA/Smf involved in DNA uptake
MVDIVELMAQGLDGDSHNECVSRGWAVLAILIGGLTISRAVASIKTADQIAIAITNAAIHAAGKTRKTRGHSR